MSMIVCSLAAMMQIVVIIIKIHPNCFFPLARGAVCSCFTVSHYLMGIFLWPFRMYLKISRASINLLTNGNGKKRAELRRSPTRMLPWAKRRSDILNWLLTYSTNMEVICAGQLSAKMRCNIRLRRWWCRRCCCHDHFAHRMRMCVWGRAERREWEQLILYARFPFY